MMPRSYRPGELDRTMVHCPACHWCGTGRDTAKVPGDVLRCPVCRAAVDVTTICGFPVMQSPQLDLDSPRRPEDN